MVHKHVSAARVDSGKTDALACSSSAQAVGQFGRKQWQGPSHARSAGLIPVLLPVHRLTARRKRQCRANQVGYAFRIFASPGQLVVSG